MEKQPRDPRPRLPLNMNSKWGDQKKKKGDTFQAVKNTQNK